MLKAYIILLVAVLFEGLGTTSLQASQQFTRSGRPSGWPSGSAVRSTC